MKVKSVLLSIGTLFGGAFLIHSASAVTYQNSVDVSFTFNSSLSISLSSADLLIANLVPGNTGYSNTISVDVTTNSATGYTLSAKVGDGTTYTNDRLVSSTGNYFTNRASSATLSNFNANEWGYTLASAIIGSTTYGGLIYNTDTTINATTNAAGAAATGYSGGNSTSFTIGAKADATQTTGDYKNVIIFTVVSNPVSTTYSIAYNTNTTDGVYNMPNNVNNVGTASSSITLSSAVPVRNTYEFKGWCTTVVADDATCSGTLYANGGTVPITVGQTNTITLYAAWENLYNILDPSVCPANSICYAPGAKNAEGSMSSLGTTLDLTDADSRAGKVSASSNSTAELIAPNYKRSGYGFAGWSTSYEAKTANNPTIYGPNETITTGDLSTNGLILYPVWIASAGDLQGWSGCSSLTQASYDSTTSTLSATLSSITALTDTRDGNVYAVARLTDGNCWMIENLRLDAENSRGAANIAKAQGYASDATYGNFIGLADSEDSYFGDGIAPTAANNATNSLYSSDGSTTINISSTNRPGYRMPRYNNNNTNMGGKNSAGVDLTASYNGSGDTVQWYSYGNYYTWPAAMASTKYYTNSSDSEASNTSICPYGWKLPLGEYSDRAGSFSHLDRTMGGDGSGNHGGSSYYNKYQWFKFPNNLIYSGHYQDNAQNPSGRSTELYYWTSTFYYQIYAFFAGTFSYNGGGFRFSNNTGTTGMNTVRCLIAQ